jgi:hypothetical protein
MATNMPTRSVKRCTPQASSNKLLAELGRLGAQALWPGARGPQARAADAGVAQPDGARLGLLELPGLAAGPLAAYVALERLDLHAGLTLLHARAHVVGQLGLAACGVLRQEFLPHQPGAVLTLHHAARLDGAALLQDERAACHARRGVLQQLGRRRGRAQHRGHIAAPRDLDHRALAALRGARLLVQAVDDAALAAARLQGERHGEGGLPLLLPAVAQQRPALVPIDQLARLAGVDRALQLHHVVELREQHAGRLHRARLAQDQPELDAVDLQPARGGDARLTALEGRWLGRRHRRQRRSLRLDLGLGIGLLLTAGGGEQGERDGAREQSVGGSGSCAQHRTSSRRCPPSLSGSREGCCVEARRFGR